MSIDKEYEACFDQWVKSQKNLIKQVEMNITNSENMIAVHKESLEIQKESLIMEQGLLDKAIEIKVENDK